MAAQDQNFLYSQEGAQMIKDYLGSMQRDQNSFEDVAYEQTPPSLPNLSLWSMQMQNMTTPPQVISHHMTPDHQSPDNQHKTMTDQSSGMTDTSNFCNTGMVKETVKVLYPCNFCNKVFNKRAVLNQHRYDIHNLEDPNKKLKPCPKPFTPISQEENKPKTVESRKRKTESDEKLVNIKRPKNNEPLGKTCPLPPCDFKASTKNQYRHMQDHLANVHFKNELAQDLPNKKPYKCPLPKCNAEFNIHQDIKRHYIGNQHGLVMKSYIEYAKKRDAGLLVNRPMGEE